MKNKESTHKRVILNGLLTVINTKRLSSNIIEIIFKSAKAFTLDPLRLGPHLKLLFPDSNGDLCFPNVNDENKVILQAGILEKARTYSIRHYDPINQLITVNFVVHEQGLATTWAQSAKEGDVIGLIGLGAKTNFDERKVFILLGDIAAMPAICYSLEQAPSSQRMLAIIEVKNESDIQPMQLSSSKQVTWLVKQGAESKLSQAITQLAIHHDEDIIIWGGMEAALAQQLRHNLCDCFTHLSKDAIHLISYWRIGFAEGQFKHRN